MPLITLVDKDGNKCNVEQSQLAAMKAAGWREPGEHAAEGDQDDGGEQHAGRPLDPERREREDEPGSVHAVGVEQPEGPGGNGPDGG